MSIDLYQPYLFGATRSNASHSRSFRGFISTGLAFRGSLHSTRALRIWQSRSSRLVTFGAGAMSGYLMSLTSLFTVRIPTPKRPTKLHTAHALRAICAIGGSDRIATPGLSCLPPRGCFTSWSWQGDLKGCDITSRTVRVLDASMPAHRGAVWVARQWIALGVFYRPLPHRTLPHPSDSYASLNVIRESHGSLMHKGLSVTFLHQWSSLAYKLG